MHSLLRVAVVVALAIAGVVGQQTRAAGLEPEKLVFVDQGMALLPDIDCGSFVLSERLVSERIQVMTFFDNDGEATRVLVTVNFSGVIRRSDTGETFMDTVAGTDTFDVVDGAFTQTATGVKFHIHIPGQGIVALTAGRQVRDTGGQIIFSAGPADIDPSNPSALCTALA
jgi:hypothetical protein